jgi:restriction system protein
MALWLVRAGGGGEYEQKFLQEKRIYVTWDELSNDLGKLKEKQDLRELLAKVYKDEDKKPKTIINWTSQIWPFVKEMKKGDWVALPSKTKAAIHFGEITGEYTNNAAGPNPFYHYREVNWFATDVLRTGLDQDLLYSFGAFMTICRVTRNNAENRIRKLAESNWKKTAAIVEEAVSRGEGETPETDIEELGRDQIAKFITRKFKGHGLTRLVEAVLQAQGYTTYRSPEGADGGVDILASPGGLGFGHPRICVQVKSQDSPIDRPTLDQLIGTMQKVGAEQGLLVSWGGFKTSVDRETPTQFFRVRLWNQVSLIQEIIANYERLDEDIKAELPLKRVWTLAAEMQE